MGAIIRERKNKKKERILLLDICYKGGRHTEFLGLKYIHEKGLKEREINKETKELAEIIRARRWNEMVSEGYDVDFKKNEKIDFIAFAESEVENYTVAKRGYYGVIRLLKKFVGSDVLYATKVTEKFLNKFYDYMEDNLTGETPATYFKKLKRLLKDATKHKIFKQNPCIGIRCRKFESKQKDVLTFDEIKLLINTDCGNKHVKDAFIFCCLTGIRHGDVRALKAVNINGNKLDLVQSKTKVRIEVVLNIDAIKIVEQRLKNKGVLFPLPSHTSCLKNLRNWLKRAGISKKVAWHNSRHSFGTNLFLYGADLLTASKLLGHRSLVHSQRYVRESEKLKEEAVNRLPTLY